ncbi:MAG: hypothetical protein IJN00_04450 [Clostridia bacterium]|nr:hypothetical protein [Clostridia bacterium]
MKHMQVIRIGALILFLLSLFASVDLGFNYVKATVPALNDGSAASACCTVFTFSDGGRSPSFMLLKQAYGSAFSCL